MKLVNRGYLTIRPNKPFWDWANEFESDMEFSVDDDVEPNVYLITDDFFDIEPILEQNFKKIFKNELSMITDEESAWPQERSMEIFLEWFELEIGTTVFDLEKSDLKVEKIE
jgi:hypothetical protein